MKIGMREVARQCNVSVCTISNVIHNKNKVSSATRKRVLDTIKKLDYDPYRNVPLATRVQVPSVGLVLQATNIMATTFYGRAIQAVKGYTEQKEYRFDLLSEGELIRQLEAGALKRNSNMGLIFFAPMAPKDTRTHYLRELKKIGMPTVMVRRTTDVPGIPVISNNDYKGMRQLLDHLFGLGHRRIGLIGTFGERWAFALERRKAYDDFLKEKGLNLIPEDICNLAGRGAERDQRVTAWREEYAGSSHGPTAICCLTDLEAATLLKSLLKRKVRVPEDISVAGYDDNYIADMIHPAITTVHVPVEETCTYAARLIVDQLEGIRADNVSISFDNELVVRESCGKIKTV